MYLPPVVTSDGRARVGRVARVHPMGVQMHEIPAAPGRHRWVPWAAVAEVGEVVRLAPGIGVREVMASPQPRLSDPGAEAHDPAWWRRLLDHYGVPPAGPPGAVRAATDARRTP